MKRVIRLSESELTRLVKRVISEDKSNEITKKYLNSLANRGELTSEIRSILWDYYIEKKDISFLQDKYMRGHNFLNNIVRTYKDVPSIEKEIGFKPYLLNTHDKRAMKKIRDAIKNIKYYVKNYGKYGINKEDVIKLFMDRMNENSSNLNEDVSKPITKELIDSLSSRLNWRVQRILMAYYVDNMKISEIIKKYGGPSYDTIKKIITKYYDEDSLINDLDSREAKSRLDMYNSSMDTINENIDIIVHITDNQYRDYNFTKDDIIKIFMDEMNEI